MSDAALFAVRVLRWLPRTREFDKHLTDCAALELLYAPYSDAAPLKLSHVLRLVPLPMVVPSGFKLDDL
jgi:hypothetical protein